MRSFFCFDSKKRFPKARYHATILDLMIRNLAIKRYKSVRDVELECKRINIFVGPPDTGKTNILEALGLWCAEFWAEISHWARVVQAPELFNDLDIQRPIEISCDDWVLRVSQDEKNSQQFVATSYKQPVDLKRPHKQRVFNSYLVNNHQKVDTAPPDISVKFYCFNRNILLNSSALGALEPVTGRNLPAVLLSNKALRQQVGKLAPEGFQIQISPHENKVSFARDADGLLISYPYSALSETMRRLIFHTMVLETNKDSTIVLDEPEAHTFPVYTKLMAERMARYSPSLQFFLTTHSPFMLLSLIENTPADELSVVYCRMENFETKAYPLKEEQLSQILDWDVDSFFNFDKFIDED
jgi:AAA15 family ATPase/GTPase